MATFLAEHLGLRAGIEPAPQTDALLAYTDSCLPRWPDDALTVDELASELTGVRPPAGLRLWDVFPYSSEVGKPFPPAISRGDVRQVLAQMQAFLGRP